MDDFNRCNSPGAWRAPLQEEWPRMHHQPAVFHARPLFTRLPNLILALAGALPWALLILLVGGLVYAASARAEDSAACDGVSLAAKLAATAPDKMAEARAEAAATPRASGCVGPPGCALADCSGPRFCDVTGPSNDCSGHGVCTATYLGGDLPVSLGACVCEVPWAGPLCDRTPCLDAARTCSGHGTCAAVGDTATRCDCDTGYSGAECDTTCIGTCQGGGGEYPFGCASHIDGAAELLCGPTGGCSYPSTAGGGPAGLIPGAAPYTKRPAAPLRRHGRPLS